MIEAFGTQVQVLFSVGLAMLLGGIIGFERELENKPAGLRTHMLVAGAAALLVALGDVVIERYAVEVGSQLMRSDPVRIIEAVITGVAFLGAGTILRHPSGSRIEGLTTAASLLFAAAVGISVALEEYVVALGVTGLVLLTLRWVALIQQRWERGSE